MPVLSRRLCLSLLVGAPGMLFATIRGHAIESLEWPARGGQASQGGFGDLGHRLERAMQGAGQGSQAARPSPPEKRDPVRDPKPNKAPRRKDRKKK